MTQQTNFFSIEELESIARDLIIKHVYEKENKEHGAYIEEIIGEKVVKIARNIHKRLDNKQTLEDSLNIIKELVDDCLYYKNNINDYISCFLRLIESAEKAGFNIYDLLKTAESIVAQTEESKT